MSQELKPKAECKKKAKPNTSEKGPKEKAKFLMKNTSARVRTVSSWCVQSMIMQMASRLLSSAARANRVAKEL